jgi:arylsulfatase A-like enzyme
MDYVLGQLVDKLQQIGELENTLIIFTSDNGPNARSRRTAAPRSAAARDRPGKAACACRPSRIGRA